MATVSPVNRENVAHGTLRIREMHIEFLFEMVLPFSFVEEHPALE